MKRRLNILLLEDDFLEAELIKHLLTKEITYFDWRHVANKNDFIKALDAAVPDIILSDNSLPQFNALEALRIARIKVKNIPFIKNRFYLIDHRQQCGHCIMPNALFAQKAFLSH